MKKDEVHQSAKKNCSDGFLYQNHVGFLLVDKRTFCIQSAEPFCIITEFTPYGDLLGFLRKKRGLEDAYYNTERLPRRSVTSHQLMQFAWEIADGMAHLSSAKVGQ